MTVTVLHLGYKIFIHLYIYTFMKNSNILGIMAIVVTTTVIAAIGIGFLLYPKTAYADATTCRQIGQPGFPDSFRDM